MFNNVTKMALAGAAILGTAMMASPDKANAHATSVGYENGGGPGIVNVWLGTYNHGGHHLEGSMNLVGVNGNTYASNTVAFTLGAGNGPTPVFDGFMSQAAAQAFKPAGLIDGTTHFYAPNGCASGTAPLVATPNTCGGGVDHWQGAVFTGLGAGDYKFTWVPAPLGQRTAEWSILNTNLEGVFTLGGIVIGDCGNPGQPPCNVPEPGSLGLFGLGLVGLGLAFNRRRRTTT